MIFTTTLQKTKSVLLMFYNWLNVKKGIEILRSLRYQRICDKYQQEELRTPPMSNSEGVVQPDRFEGATVNVIDFSDWFLK